MAQNITSSHKVPNTQRSPSSSPFLPLVRPSAGSQGSGKVESPSRFNRALGSLVLCLSMGTLEKEWIPSLHFNCKKKKEKKSIKVISARINLLLLKPVLQLKTLTCSPVLLHFKIRRIKYDLRVFLIKIHNCHNMLRGAFECDSVFFTAHWLLILDPRGFLLFSKCRKICQVYCP